MPGPMRCPNCGNILTDGAKFCNHCGMPLALADDTMDYYGAGTEEYSDGDILDGEYNSSDSKKFVWKDYYNYIAMVLLIAIAAIVGLGVRSYKAHKDDPSDSKPYVSEQEGETLDDGDSGDAISISDDADDTDADSDWDAPDAADVEDSDFDMNQEDQNSDNTSDTAYVQTDTGIEAQIQDIREEYNDIESDISTGRYYSQDISGRGITRFYNNKNQIKAVKVQPGADGSSYQRSYYYNDGELIFAYYEGKDAHRFYFEDEEMIRWRYAADAGMPDSAENHDSENNAEYNTWENAVLNDSEKYQSDLVNKDNTSNNRNTEAYVDTSSQFILPQSSSEYLSRGDLAGLTKDQCRIARNEIYARHGRRFQDKELQAYFLSCDWYTPSVDPDDFNESVLNKYETANKDLIVLYEKEMGYSK